MSILVCYSDSPKEHLIAISKLQHPDSVSLCDVVTNTWGSFFFLCILACSLETLVHTKLPALLWAHRETGHLARSVLWSQVAHLMTAGKHRDRGRDVGGAGGPVSLSMLQVTASLGPTSEFPPFPNNAIKLGICQ